MGFPLWTLFGMALTAAGALLMLAFAYVAQSPRMMNRLGLAGSRLDLRARTFTGFALAFLVLAFGFFVAGVPLVNDTPEPEAEVAVPTADANESEAVAAAPTQEPDSAEETSEDVEAPVEEGGEDDQPETGAVVGPPPAAQTATAETLADDELPTTTATPLPTATPTNTPTNTPTPTPSPTATSTPLPTLTPTPIFEETAVVNTGTSTLWLKRTPGGRDLTVVRGGDVVILLGGHANASGALWREVSTVNGVIGWVQEAFLGLEEEGESETS